jgi:hypothetical protein
MMGSGDLVAVLVDMLSGRGEIWLGSGVGRRARNGISLQQWKLWSGQKYLEVKLFEARFYENID